MDQFVRKCCLTPFSLGEAALVMLVPLESQGVPKSNQTYNLLLNAMCQNINAFVKFGFFLTALLLMFLTQKGNAYASQGSELAKEVLEKMRSTPTEQALNALVRKATQEKSRLSTHDRIDYAECLWYALAKLSGSDEEEKADDIMMLMPGGISQQEIVAGCSRLLSSDDASVKRTGENNLMQGSVKLPNGKMGQDISVFSTALHDPKVRQDRLIPALFEVAPVESAQWFSDHTGLSAGDRAALESDLQKAWQIHRADNDPSADLGTKAILDDKVKKPLLDHWLNSPSWILRSLANGLLQKHQEWQTPDLKKGMQPVHVPEGLQISSY